MVKYSKEPDNPTKSCKARGSDLRVHFKVAWPVKSAKGSFWIYSRNAESNAEVKRLRCGRAYISQSQVNQAQKQRRRHLSMPWEGLNVECFFLLILL
ncbi:hypothetical protein CUMW_131360 [Citrus unshiu]|uniref:Uncharacterized protein n=1 Tax=Citrus unshiu TaxID=55188 RepID=A0A2H5PFC6_CITUN|nr:hypothetical protein CUMW_131360 [Citrus unshiu]